MSYVDNLVLDPVGDYDVKRAIGCSSGQWAVLCTYANINPMAKYKPVRYNQKEQMTLAQITSTRFGFPSTTPFFTGGQTNPSITWEYQKPRGRSYNEHYRITDFYKYFHLACVPFAFGVSGALQDGLGVSFYINNMAAAYYRDKGENVEWNGDYGLSITELFAYSSNASDNSYIAICIHDLTKGDSVVVVTNRKLRDIGTSVDTIVLYPTARTLNGINYPAVAMLNDSTRNGNDFRIIIGLVNSNTSPTAPYQVFDDSTTPNSNGITLYSLAIKQGIDRKDLKLSSLHTIRGLQCYFDANTSAVTMTYFGRVERNGQMMDKYTLSADLVGIFITPSAHWSPENGDIGVKIVVSANGLVGDAPVEGSVTVGTGVSIPSAGQTYYKDPLYQLRNINVYFYQGTGTPEVYFKAFATEIYENVAFANSLTIAAPSHS